MDTINILYLRGETRVYATEAPEHKPLLFTPRDEKDPLFPARLFMTPLETVINRIKRRNNSEISRLKSLG